MRANEQKWEYSTYFEDQETIEKMTIIFMMRILDNEDL